ncbi:MAG: c-type cytochrome [Ardenticatenaceae bacterium]|nr:c-type cytochrome [Ardenticatenaceae bacterium]
MRKLTLTILLMLLLSFGLAACGGGGDEPADDGGDTTSTSVGDAANGERLFNETVIGPASAPGCITCHSLEPGVVLVGPSQSDVGARAETTGPELGLTAEEYLRQSIVEPNAHIAEGFTEGVMYQNFGEELTNTQINDLVAFMLTLK